MMRSEQFKVLAIVAVAGLTCSAAVAQPAAKSQVATHSTPRAAAAIQSGAVVHYPNEYRKVARINNQLVAMGPWIPYVQPVSDAGTPTICWDAYHDAGGALPNTAPESNRWLLQWTSGADDFTEAGMACPVNGILPAAIPVSAKYFDYLSYDKAGGDQYTTIFTSEAYFDTAAPDATWGIFPGWQFHAAAIAPGSFYYWPLALTDPNVWTLPTDGNGGVIVTTTRDAAGAVPAFGYQFGLWGTQEHTTPPPSPAKIGTSGPNQWADTSTGTIFAAGLTTNLPDGHFTLACENYAWSYGVNPNPLGMCFDLGFDAPAATACYANCDGSTGSPLLTANDFQCFLNQFAQATSYANCDGSTASPVLTANDFQCFLNKYAIGCS